MQFFKDRKKYVRLVQEGAFHRLIFKVGEGGGRLGPHVCFPPNGHPCNSPGWDQGQENNARGSVNLYSFTHFWYLFRHYFTLFNFFLHLEELHKN